MPLFLAGDRFTSVLTLVSDASDPTYADVLIRDTFGSVLLSKRVNFKPHSRQQLDLGELLAKAGSTATRGSILVQPSKSLAGPVILGTLAMTYTGSSAPTYIDEEISAPSSSTSPSLVGVADPSDGAPVLAIMSLVSAVQHIRVECFGEQGVSGTRQITLAPGQTSFTPACAKEEAEPDIADPFLGEHSGSAQTATGIRLTSDGARGTFAAFALAPHMDEGDRSFSSVLFSNPQAAHSSGIVFAGVPVGAASLLPAGDYTPHISLVNFAAIPAHVNVIFAHNSSADPATPQEVSSVTLPPNSSREVTLANLSGDPNLQNSFMVSSDAVPGMLAAKFVARGGPQLRRVELQAKDERDQHNGGVHPWSIENGTDSTLLLLNHGTGPQEFTVSVAGSETWQKTYTLTSMQTKAISLRDLVESRTKDDTGRTLPATLQSGEVNWFVPDSTESSGRLLHTDRAAGMARNDSCGYSNLLCGAFVTVYNPQFADGTTVDFASITAITCTNGTPNACNGQQTGNGGSFGPTWVSLTPSVASISGSNAVSNVYLTGNAGGTSQINGHLQSSYCSAGAGGTVSVVGCPTTIAVGTNSVNPTVASYVPTYLTGIGLYAAMQVGPPQLNFNNAQIIESVSTSSNTCPASFGNLCFGNSTFTVGTGGKSQKTGYSLAAATNQFWDVHLTIDTYSYNDNAGIQSCSAVCSQTYTCAGNPVGHFSITRVFTKGVDNSYNVTNVLATKR